MKLSGYDYNIQYKCGKSLVLADTMSRLSSSENHEITGLTANIHSLVSISDPRLLELQSETKNDPVLQKLVLCVQNGWPSTVKQIDSDIRE